MSDQALLSIVTPCHNGAKFLRAAADSVLTQTHTCLEYIIVNNASTDETGEISEEIARSDSRVRVIHQPELVPMIVNWNTAIESISSDSAFVTLLCADDKLYPDFLEKMYHAGSSSSQIGVVGCYRLEGENISPQLTGLLPMQNLGKEICRANLRMDYRMFCCPSGMMYRSELVRRSKPFYEEKCVHADVRVCYKLLAECDFAFCQDVLASFSQHEGTVTTQIADRKGTNELERLMMTLDYGQTYFDSDEYAQLVKRIQRRYYIDVASRMFSSNRKQVLAFHRQRWAEVGGSFSNVRLARAIARVAAVHALDLKGLIKLLSSLFCSSFKISKDKVSSEAHIPRSC